MPEWQQPRNSHTRNSKKQTVTESVAVFCFERIHMINFRKAEKNDLESILGIGEDAKRRLKELGTSQWQKGYPGREDWLLGINRGEAVIAEKDGVTAGVFCITVEPEDTYDSIKGTWLTGEKDAYITLHRMCVSGEYLRKGIGTEIIRYVTEKGKEKGLSSVRTDTHPLNTPMRNLLEKEGFSLCGSLILTYGPEKGDGREGYEKLIK